MQLKEASFFDVSIVVMFILVADEVYNHIWSLTFWWSLKLQFTLHMIP